MSSFKYFQLDEFIRYHQFNITGPSFKLKIQIYVQASELLL